MYLKFAWRYFRAKKSANAINIIAWVTVGVIAFATACQILVLSVFNGFEGLVKSLYASFYADIKVIPAKGKTITLTPEQFNQLQQLKFVVGVSGVAEEKALLKQEDIQTIVVLKGVDNQFENTSGIVGKITQGKFDLGTAEKPGLVVGAGIQNAAGININGAFEASNLTLILPKKGAVSVNDPLQSISEGNISATGVFAIQQEFDNKYAITNIDFVKLLIGLDKNEFSAAEINLLPNSDLENSKAIIATVLGDNYKIQTKYEQNTSLYQTMKMEKWAIYAILTLILLIAAFNMISALTMLVLEKKKDIAILQSIGATRTLILKIFLSEGILLGAIGAGIGIFLAIVISILQVKYKLIKLQGGSFLIDYFPVKLQFSDFVLVTGTALLITLLAAFFPAYKASKQALDLS